MRAKNSIRDEIVNLFKDDITIAISEIFMLYDNLGIPKSTIYSRINYLLKNGIIYKVGRGLYKLGSKSVFTFNPNGQSISTYNQISEQFPYLKFCVWDISIINEFSHNILNFSVTFLDVERDAISAVYNFVRESNNKIIPAGKLYDDISQFDDFVIIRPLVTDSPLQSIEGIIVPTLEKILVDVATDKEFLPLQGNEIATIFENAFRLYSINSSKLLRYASRKEKKITISKILESLPIR